MASKVVNRCVDGSADGGVGVEDDVVGGVVDQADRQRHDQLAAAGLGQLPAAQPGLDEMELSLAELAFHAQQEPVVEVARVVEAVFVADQRAGHAAQFQELVPVGGVSGQPGAFQAEHDPGAAEGHFGDQLLEPFPVGGGGAGLALVDVDHGDLAGGPAQRDRLAAQVVLADRGFGVVDDLLEAGLADIQQGGLGQVGGGHLRGGGIGEHGCSFAGDCGVVRCLPARRRARPGRGRARWRPARAAGLAAGPPARTLVWCCWWLRRSGGPGHAARR